MTGERRFLGLFTSAAYTESVQRVPIIKEKIATVLERSGFTADSHSGKDLLEVLETYPRDELFQTDADDLYDIATEVLHLQERRKTRLFLRKDEYGRFMSCLVYIPRDRYTTAVRLKMEGILRTAFDGASVDYTTRVSESVLARLHFVVRVGQGQPIPDVDEVELQRLLVDATRTWDEDLAEAARSEYGEEAGARLVGLYGRAFPEAYKEDFSPRVGVVDLRHVEALEREDSIRLNLYQEPGSPADERRFKLYRRGPLSLTAVLPLFTHLGCRGRRRAALRDHGDPTALSVCVYDFGLKAPRPEMWTGTRPRRACASCSRTRSRPSGTGGPRATGSTRSSSAPGSPGARSSSCAPWPSTCARPARPSARSTSSARSSPTCALAARARRAVRGAVRPRPVRHAGPRRGGARDRPERAWSSRSPRASTQVASLDHDRIVRAFLGVIRATLRTNYYQHDAGSPSEAPAPKSYVSFKLDPMAVPGLPAPRPMFEIWVYSPRVEGVHLRFGKVARGGLRWSDRREDFRTEVLGLVKAQMVKNAVIVPTGSKGGFFAKRCRTPPWTARPGWPRASPPTSCSSRRCSTSPTTWSAPRSCRRSAVVRHDEDDTYLVVAADKGTATFSDIANGVAQSYGFWLDDAFASGGSAGYDHKAMGITARGAWESVKRHFREMGVDTQTQDFTAVGVGDMSGDVFGNGMLLSEHIRLVAAFDHRHIFLDPDPVAATSFPERRRLFDLPRSSWADYDTTLISEGGGVYPRSAKSVPISPQMAEALGLAKGVDDDDAGRPDEGDPARAGRPALERRHRHLRQGRRPRPTPRSATGPTTRSASTGTRCAAR